MQIWKLQNLMRLPLYRMDKNGAVGQTYDVLPIRITSTFGVQMKNGRLHTEAKANLNLISPWCPLCLRGSIFSFLPLGELGVLAVQNLLFLFL
jgi:hypothetical protein